MHRAVLAATALEMHEHMRDACLLLAWAGVAMAVDQSSQGRRRRP